MSRCKFCNSDKFKANQWCLHEVVVDGNNEFIIDSNNITSAEKPEGMYTCMGCGRSAEFLEELVDYTEGDFE